MRSEAEPWWRQAEADLDGARDNLRLGHWYITTWLAHLAVEKGLKALHTQNNGTLPPQTHSLIHLGTVLAVPAQIGSDLGYLNPAFDLARYPDPRARTAPVDEITEQTALRDLEVAERVMAWCRQELSV